MARRALQLYASGRGVRPAALEASIISLQRTAGNAAVTALLQRRAEAQDADTSPVLGVIGQGKGRPLPSRVRSEMEARFGHDFSQVRVHSDSEAAASAASVSAKAYTVGDEIVFGAGGYSRRTLAHELTHVVQQRQGPVSGVDTGDGIAVSSPQDPFEQEAEATADRVMAGPVSAGGVGVATVSSGVQRACGCARGSGCECGTTQAASPTRPRWERWRRQRLLEYPPR